SLFKTTIGVKQGGPLSPKLFSIYVEDLIKEIESKKLGTKIHNLYTGIIMYADDILLLMPSIKELQEALYICEKYGINNEIKFNANKTQFIIFGKKTKIQESKPEMYNEEIKMVEKIKYLGVYLNRKNNNKDQIENRIKSAFKTMASIKYLQTENQHLNTSFNIWIGKLCTKEFEDKKYSNNGEYNDKKNDKFKKNSRSTNLLSALGLEKMEQKLMKEKLGFLKRLANNDLTKKILEELERCNGETKKLSNKSSLKKIAEYLECDELDFDVL
ncbi:RNA-directed DNA polymerase from mobile element jockey-like, partial [Brachionus plicatilis]